MHTVTLSSDEIRLILDWAGVADRESGAAPSDSELSLVGRLAPLVGSTPEQALPYYARTEAHQ